MRSTCIGACAGVVLAAASLAGLAQPPEGKGRPTDAGRPAFASFPVPQKSVGVLHSQQPLAFTPVAVPAMPQGNATGAAIGNVTFAASPIAFASKEPLEESKADDGRRYSLEAVLPTAPGAFPSIPKQAPIPVCFAR